MPVLGPLGARIAPPRLPTGRSGPARATAGRVSDGTLPAYRFWGDGMALPRPGRRNGHIPSLEDEPRKHA